MKLLSECLQGVDLEYWSHCAKERQPVLSFPPHGHKSSLGTIDKPAFLILGFNWSMTFYSILHRIGGGLKRRADSYSSG